MGDLRSIRVFVLGEAKRPGSYTDSGLATMTTALFASGGVRPIGSLRDIQLKRRGAVVRHLDLYDLLIQGNTTDDAKLQPGDVLFIPPVGATVSVSGEVKRAAIYELRGESDLADALRIAGGLTPEADASRGSLQRVDEQSRRVVLDVNLNQPGGRTQKLRNGDILHIERLRPQVDVGVLLEGFVHRPGPRAWHEGLRISEVIGSIDELKPTADAHYLLVRRESGADRHVEVLSADLTAALAARGSAADVVLKPRDRVTVFDLAPGRDRIIKPLLDELRLQSDLSRPLPVVEVTGEVKVPGEYPLEPGMQVSDLLRAGGSLAPSAYLGQAELARYEVTGAGARQADVVAIDLAGVRRGDPSANLALKPYDHLLVKTTTDWQKQNQVTLEGEVRFPGVYPIRKGESLHELLERAGGLTPLGYAKAAIFTREEIRQLEQRELARLAERMQSDLVGLAVQGAAAAQVSAAAQNSTGASLAAGQALLAQLKQTQPVGRLVIDLPGILAAQAGGPQDVLLRDGDRLVVPPFRQTVTVLGEVQSSTTLLYRKSLSRDDYIDRTGGVTRKADKSKIYVVRADGSVEADHSSMLTRTRAVSMQPGDTIVVPMDAERIPRLPLWQSVTQILANMAITFAALKQL
jgi:protein involved in polysaccharide export with SLBB domain